MNTCYANYIFDLYGTLVDIRTDETMPELWQTAANFFAAKEIIFTADELQDTYRQLCRKITAEKEFLLAQQEISGSAEIDLFDVWDAIAAQKQKQLTTAEKQEFSLLFRTASTLKLRLFPGAAEVLKQLKNAGKTVCLLTNAQSSFTLPELAQLGINQAFDHIFISSQCGVKKPSPAFFAQLAAYGLKPEESLMVGNDDICDCHGAAAAGMDSLYICTEQSPERKLPLPKNCTEISSLGDVLRYSGISANETKER